MLTNGDGSRRDEKLARVKAVRHASYSSQRFWYHPPPIRIKILVLRCLVYEAAVAGWTVVAPSKADTAMPGSIFLFVFASYWASALVRRLNSHSLRPQVSEVGSTLPVEHVACLSDASVWRLVRSVPVNIELQIDVSKDEKHNENNDFLLTVVFDHLPLQGSIVD